MKIERLLEQAITQLEKVNREEVESVSIDSYKHDDGTTSFTVTVNFVAKGGE